MAITRGKICFPNEIHNLIINEIGFDYQLYPRAAETLLALKTLSACRLVSHDICLLATPFMFSTILLAYKKRHYNGDLHCKRPRSLLRILNNNDNFFSSTVRKVVYHYKKENLGNSEDGTIFSMVLGQLPRIQKFSFESVREIQFSSIAPEFISAIRNLCRSPLLTTLGLRFIQDFPVTIITGCPNLRALRLQLTELLCTSSLFISKF